MRIIYRQPSTENEYEAYFKFRWKYLRKPLGLGRGTEQDDLEESAIHIAAFNDEKIVGVARLHTEEASIARIRYMVVDPKFRNQSIGTQLLTKLEKIAKRESIKLCWLHAREEAIPFYAKNDYKIQGQANSELAIKHYRMEKIL